ncbi:MAG: penicillin-binding transpeptidase domain-containing protein, partial [Gemmatimonadales bacterium]
MPVNRAHAERSTNPDGRIRWLGVFLLLGGLAMIGRAGYLQLARGGAYADIAESERTERLVIEAQRGVISDRTGTHLATSLERYRIDIAGVQVQHPDSLLRIYRRDIGRDVKRLETALRTKRDFYAHGPFTANQMRRLRNMAGVYPRPLYRREYPSGPLARPLIGNLWADRGEGRTGLERFLDSLLAGVPGEAVLIKDAKGQTYASPGRVARPAVRGHDVILTIDRELQEIAEGSLAAVFREASPRRGDIVFLDPRTGEVLAAAAREVDSLGREVVSASFFGSSFEPGSTAKPFTAAALLALGRVDSTDRVSPENGTWPVPGRSRPVRDDHP